SLFYDASSSNQDTSPIVFCPVSVPDLQTGNVKPSLGRSSSGNSRRGHSGNVKLAVSAKGAFATGECGQLSFLTLFPSPVLESTGPPAMGRRSTRMRPGARPVIHRLLVRRLSIRFGR